MASNLKRVSPDVDVAVTALADREDRSFVAQLDRVVAAGLAALGEDVPDKLAPKGTSQPTRRGRARTTKATTPSAPSAQATTSTTREPATATS